MTIVLKISMPDLCSYFIEKNDHKHPNKMTECSGGTFWNTRPQSDQFHMTNLFGKSMVV